MKLIEEIQKGESKRLEFKSVLPNSDSIAKCITAFANTSGGKLIIGVDDNRNIIGIDDNDIFAMQDKVSSIIYDMCYPKIIPEIYNVNIDNKIVLVIDIVRGTNKPYFLKHYGKENGTYIRIGATNRLADITILNELERQKNNIGYDEEVSDEITFDELDITPLHDKFKAIGKELTLDKLQNLKLIKTVNNTVFPTNALMIILGKMDNCTIKCARFRGKTMEYFIDKKEYSGEIFTMLDNALAFILNHINLHAEIKGLYRVETYEIPEIAIREALINAIIHRDYSNKGRDIKIGIYDDIVNIVSPGGLPNSLIIDDIFNGRSESRNRAVANIFKELGLIEQLGSGIKKIVSLCENSDLKTPLIEESNDFFNIEIYRSIQSSEQESINAEDESEDKEQNTVEKNDFSTSMTEKTSVKNDFSTSMSEKTSVKNDFSTSMSVKTSVKILTYINSNNDITIPELSELIGVSERSIERNLDKLKKEGKLRRIGPDKGGYWEVCS